MKKTAPLLLLIVLFAVATWYFFTQQPDPVHELPPPNLPESTSAETLAPEPQIADIVEYPELETVPVPEPLPLLIESDPELTKALLEIVGADRLTEYLVKDQVISRVVAMVDSLSSRQVPALINPIKPAENKFIVKTEGENVVMNAANFSRYDGYVALMQDVDTGAVMTLYQRFQPLFQQAWEKNGGEGAFNERVLEVIDQLLETPDVPGPVYLSKPEAVYLFEETELESMTAGQKILVRMGSVNASVVKEKLAEVRAELKP